MAKRVALLIGVSEYESGFAPLPSAVRDVQAMQAMLQNPQIGCFDEVNALANPQRQEMEEAIEALFADRRKDDFLLLYFSGHGVKDDTGNLYLAAHKTRKAANGRLVTPTKIYEWRGDTLKNLGYKTDALQDYKKAKELFRTSGDLNNHDRMEDKIKQFQN